MRRIVFLTVIMLISCVAAEAKEIETPIIWECGQNVPNSAYWRKYGAELEEMLPFDGVWLDVEYPVTKGGTLKVSWENWLGSKVFSKTRLTEDMVKPFVEDMKAANLKKLKYNMVGLVTHPRPHIMNWFDDAWWADICNNIQILAGAAKDAGCAGLVIDAEMYGSRLWNWQSLVDSTDQKQSYAEYVPIVRKRGREFGKALSKGFPDCIILFFESYGRVAVQTEDAMRNGKGVETTPYSLLGPWLDGMLEGTSDETILVDGYESSYSFTETAQFEEGRKNVLDESLKISAVPELFKKKTRCGFGLWTDNRYDNYKYYPRNPELNRFSPARLQHAIYTALKHGDGFVWLWNEIPNWYVDGPDGKPHPPATQQRKAFGIDKRYRKAVVEARIWPGVNTSKPPKPRYLDPHTLGFIDGDKLAELLKSTKKVMALPNDNWLFKADEKDVGADEHWFDLSTSTADWKPIKIAEFWENQGFGYLDGMGWYRREVKFNKLPKAKKLYMHFEGVDESLTLWIDGKYAGAYERGSLGWNKPFVIEVTDFIHQGKTHTVTFRVHDRRRMGGVWKGVSLIAQ